MCFFFCFLYSHELGKSKKGMLKKLGLAVVDENMNHKKQEKVMCYKCPASDLETDLSSKKKKSNLPKKVTSSSIRKLKFTSQQQVHINLSFSLLQDTHSVDHHASVPRKLRSGALFVFQ